MISESSLTNDEALEECVVLDQSTEIIDWRLEDHQSFSCIYPLIRNFYATYLRSKYPLEVFCFHRPVSKSTATTELSYLVSRKPAKGPSMNTANHGKINRAQSHLFITQDIHASHVTELLCRCSQYNKPIRVLEWQGIQLIQGTKHEIRIHEIRETQTSLVPIKKLAPLNSYLIRQIGRELNYDWIQAYLDTICIYFTCILDYLENSCCSVIYYDDLIEPRSIALRLACAYYGIKAVEVVHGSVFEHKYQYRLNGNVQSCPLYLDYYPDIFLTLSPLEQQSWLVSANNCARLSHPVLAIPPVLAPEERYGSPTDVDILVFFGKTNSPLGQLATQNIDEMFLLIRTLVGICDLKPRIGLKLHPHSSSDNIQFQVLSQYLSLKNIDFYLIDRACDPRDLSAKYIIPLAETSAWKIFEDRPDVRCLFLRDNATYRLITQASHIYRIFTRYEDAVGSIRDSWNASARRLTGWKTT